MGLMGLMGSIEGTMDLASMQGGLCRGGSFPIRTLTGCYGGPVTRLLCT